MWNVYDFSSLRSYIETFLTPCTILSGRHQCVHRFPCNRHRLRSRRKPERKEARLVLIFLSDSRMVAAVH
jgi:hypothetical protein